MSEMLVTTVGVKLNVLFLNKEMSSACTLIFQNATIPLGQDTGQDIYIYKN